MNRIDVAAALITVGSGLTVLGMFMLILEGKKAQTVIPSRGLHSV